VASGKIALAGSGAETTGSAVRTNSSELIPAAAV
tara:strand:+ start:288 stop:389 length:102 start_codon:yes stop_codon:yes gene_type:complete